MRRMTLFTATTMLAVLAAGAVSAKEVTYVTDSCWSGTMETITQMIDKAAKPPKRNIAMAFNFVGTHRTRLNGAEKPELVSVQCNGVGALVAGGYTHNGYCKGVAKDGNSWFGKYDGNLKGSTWTFLSDTGQFAGIKGGGTTQSIGRFPRLGKGIILNCVVGTGSYTLPDG